MEQKEYIRQSKRKARRQICNYQKSESETIAEINAKLDAIETSSKTPAAPAPSSSDVEWLDVLETACNIIF